ncbi:hypothetical protein JTB14_003496, partial [Gonioctena quinquepunctata]
PDAIRALGGKGGNHSHYQVIGEAAMSSFLPVPLVSLGQSPGKESRKGHRDPGSQGVAPSRRRDAWHWGLLGESKGKEWRSPEHSSLLGSSGTAKEMGKRRDCGSHVERGVREVNKEIDREPKKQDREWQMDKLRSTTC